MDRIIGTNGDDTNLVGTDFDDLIYGRRGNDIIIGLAGDDLLRGDEGNDFIDGGDGDDIIRGGGLSFGTSNDDDTLIGGAGNDNISGYDGDDVISGDLAIDLNTFTTPESSQDGNDFLDGGNGNDIISGGGGNDTINGGNDDDLLFGGSGDDFLIGGSGNDIFIAGTGNDFALGGFGDDIFDGGEGDDQLFGGLGNDTMYGGSGNDSIYGSLSQQDADDDETVGNILVGESGDDYILAGSGNDLIYGDRDTLGLPDGNDFLLAGGGNDTVFGGGGNDTINGGDGNDIIDGGDNDLNGSIFNDLDPSLGGFGGNDELSGGGGDDIVVGGFGSDTLNGGGGFGEYDILVGGVYLDLDGDGQRESPFAESEILNLLFGVSAVSESDTFVLGNSDVNLYAGGFGGITTLLDGFKVSGLLDRADIFDFQNGVDKIQVNNPDDLKFHAFNDAAGTPTTLIGVTVNETFEVIGQVIGFSANAITDFAAGTFIIPPTTTV